MNRRAAFRPGDARRNARDHATPAFAQDEEPHELPDDPNSLTVAVGGAFVSQL